MKHGTPSMYNVGRCRCEPCRAAQAAYAKRYRYRTRYDYVGQRPTVRQRVDAAPILAHIDALMAAGYSAAEIAREAGLRDRTVQHLAGQRPAGCHRDTAAAVLSVPVPPASEDIVDEVLVERVLAGVADVGDLTPAERREAVRRAIATGRGWNYCQDVLRVSSQTIRRALTEETAA